MHAGCHRGRLFQRDFNGPFGGEGLSRLPGPHKRAVPDQFRQHRPRGQPAGEFTDLPAAAVAQRAVKVCRRLIGVYGFAVSSHPELHGVLAFGIWTFESLHRLIKFPFRGEFTADKRPRQRARPPVNASGS